MLNGLDGHLGEDDYSEPLEILINSANKNNKFSKMTSGMKKDLPSIR